MEQPNAKEVHVLRLIGEGEPLYFVKRTAIGPMTGTLEEARKYPTRDAAVSALFGEARHWLCAWEVRPAAEGRGEGER